MSLIRQKGTAIIVALFLVGLVAVIALTMMDRLSRDIRRTQLLLRSTQAGLHAQGSLDWALDTLRYHWMNQKKGQLVDVLPLSSPVSTSDHLQISSTIEDAQAFFNLNNLSSDDWQICFLRLLLIADPELSAENAQNIVKSTANWISPVSKDIEEDLQYTRLPQPYRSPHRPMASVSEFRLVRGVTARLYRRLLPYITALPEMTSINVNSAPAAVLQSLSASLTVEGAKGIEAYRRQQPFLTVDQFLTMDIARNNAMHGNVVTVDSHYFLIRTWVEDPNQHLQLTTLAHRFTQGNQAVLHVLWQSKGGI